MGLKFNIPIREEQIAARAKSDAENQKLAALTAEIQAESANRQSADAALQADIAALNTALSDEITLRANNENILKQDYTSKITQETNKSEQADAALQRTGDTTRAP